MSFSLRLVVATFIGVAAGILSGSWAHALIARLTANYPTLTSGAKRSAKPNRFLPAGPRPPRSSNNGFTD
jgi:hypothetical protein